MSKNKIFILDCIFTFLVLFFITKGLLFDDLTNHYTRSLLIFEFILLVFNIYLLLEHLRNLKHKV